MVLVVILVLAWLVILGPTVFRRRSEHGGGVSSVSHFHHQLQVLEHSRGMPIVSPAFRLQSVAGQPAPAEMNAGMYPVDLFSLWLAPSNCPGRPWPSWAKNSPAANLPLDSRIPI